MTGSLRGGGRARAPVLPASSWLVGMFVRQVGGARGGGQPTVAAGPAYRRAAS